MLLTAHKTVKISDFGLAVRLTSQDAEYWSRQEVPTPYKWSAPESLRDAVYSARSDVWSLGVLLWEMFSLGMVPYPEIPNIDLQFVQVPYFFTSNNMVFSRR